MEDLWTASTPRGPLNKYTGGTAEADAKAAARVLAATGHVGNVHHIVDGRAELVESIPPAWACEDCGWTWPLPGQPPEGAECDNCGGTLVRPDR